jgi:hypothetical protein
MASPPLPAPPPPVHQLPGHTPSEPATRRQVRQAWLLIAMGVLIPVIAVGGAIMGGLLIQRGHRSVGMPILVVGLAVFVGRLALFASTGFQTAF